MSTFTGIREGLATRDLTRNRPGTTVEAVRPPLSLTTIWTILRFTFGLVPIVAGLDKFTNLLTNWEGYLNPVVLKLIPLGGHSVLEIVGVVEIMAGILTLARPRLGGLIVMTWMVCIALSLIASGRYIDVAVRDLVMAIGAFTLASLSSIVIDTRTGRSS